MHVDVFVDTNGFIHFKDLKDRPWGALFPGAMSVDLMVASSVIKELDHHKNSTNDRRRNRARLALADIEKASENDGLALVLKEKPVLVRLVISIVAVDWKAVPNLDRAKPDDQLVAEARSYSTAAVVLTNDTGPRIRARIIGLKAVAPPPDWILEPEKTDDQRRIAELRRELENALSTKPKIDASFDGFFTTAPSFDFEVPVLRELTNSEIARTREKYVSTARSMYRMERQLDPLSAFRESRTTFERYEDNVQEYLAGLHIALMRYLRIGNVVVVVKNNSGVAADGLRLRVTVSGAYLIDENDDLRGNCKPPERPSAYIRDDFVHYIGRYDIGPREHDPLAFRWMKRPDGEEGIYQCGEFRATEETRFNEFLLAPRELPTSGTIKVEITATNLPKPVTIEAPFTMREVQASWSDEAVLSALENDLANAIRGAGVR